jgi:cephalosporin hydroxylase
MAPTAAATPTEAVPKLLNYGNNHQWIQLFRGDSHDELMLKSVKRFLAGKKLDLLFIDGDHTYEGVKRDWEMYSPLVAKAGLSSSTTSSSTSTFPTVALTPSGTN